MHPKPLAIYNVVRTGISIIYSPLPLVDFLLSVSTLITVDPRPNDLSIILYRDLQRLSLLINGLQQKPKLYIIFSHASILALCGITSTTAHVIIRKQKQPNRNPEREGKKFTLPTLIYNLVCTRWVKSQQPVMATESELPRHMRIPGEDGYRTPTIEDAERALSVLGAVEESPGGGIREAHSSALDAALQRASSRATVKTKPDKEAAVCREYNGLGLFGLKRTVSGELSWKKRIRHITWAYFTLTMATGGLANVLYEGLHWSISFLFG